MATQLGVINDALHMVGEGELSAAELTARSNEKARVMTGAWPDAVDFCLSSAPWLFASRIAAVEPFNNGGAGEYEDFAAPGFYRAFKIPADHLRTNWIRETAFPGALPMIFHAQDGFWHTNSASVVASYVSHEYRPPETWTPLFGKVVSSFLAWDKGARIRPAADSNELRLKFEAVKMEAETTDASEMPFTWLGAGRLARSRGGGRYSGNFGRA